MLSFEQFSDLLIRCAEATENEYFDLIIASNARVHHLGVLGRYMASGPHLGSAIDDLVTNHPRYVRGGGPYLLDAGDGDVILAYRTHSPGLRAAARIARGAAAFGHAVFSVICGVTPKAVLISLPPPPDGHAYEVAFGRTPIRFNAEHFALVYSRSALRTPTLMSDPELRRHLGATIAARWAIHQPDVRERVMRALVPSICLGTHSLESTAQRIGVAPDLLSRELKALGCSFRELLVEARLEMASQFLSDARMSISQIAHILGYSEISAFTRFFTSARGLSPAEWRRRNAEPFRQAAPRPRAAGMTIPPVAGPGHPGGPG